MKTKNILSLIIVLGLSLSVIGYASQPQPQLPRWYNVEIQTEQGTESLILEKGNPVELQIKVTAIYGDLVDVRCFWGLPDQIKVIDEGNVPKDKITIKEGNSKNFHAKIATEQNIIEDWLSFKIIAAFPYRAVKNIVTKQFSDYGLKILSEDLEKLKKNGFKGWDSIKISTLKWN